MVASAFFVKTFGREKQATGKGSVLQLFMATLVSIDGSGVGYLEVFLRRVAEFVLSSKSEISVTFFGKLLFPSLFLRGQRIRKGCIMNLIVRYCSAAI